MPEDASPIDAWQLLQNLSAFGNGGTPVVQAKLVTQATINGARRVGQLALFNADGSPFTGGDGGGGATYGGLGTTLSLYLSTLPSAPDDAVLVLEDTSVGGIHKVMRINDSFGNPLLVLMNDGGLKVADGISFTKSNLEPTVRLGWLKESTSQGPAIILGQVGSGGTAVLDDQGTSIAIDAGKEVHLALTSDGAIRSSKNLRTSFGTGGVTNTGAVGPTFEPGFQAASGYGTGTVTFYRASDGVWRTPNSLIIDGTLTASGLISPPVFGINVQTGASYTLVVDDNGKIIERDNSGANTVIVPNESSVYYPIGSRITIRQTNDGQTTIVAGSNVFLRARIGLKLAGKWAQAYLDKRAANEWVVSGDVIPSSGDTTAPSVPTNLAASALGAYSISLSWAASTDDVGVTGYQIYRNNATTPTAFSATNSYIDTQLTPSTAYTYKVSAVDASGNESAKSSQAGATTNAAPVDPPPGGGGGTRSPLLQPFSSDSHFNTPIGSNVQYEGAGATITSAYLNWSLPSGSGMPVTAWVNCESYSIPVNVATTSDPYAYIEDTVHPENSRYAYIPANATISPGEDRNLGVIQPDHQTSIEAWGTTKISNNSWQALRVVTANLYGKGGGPLGGVRAAGNSMFGGLIRKWEVDPNDPNYTDGVIRHALAMNLDFNMFLLSGGYFGYDQNGYSTYEGYVWPATEMDSFAAWMGYQGPIPMGTLFAIPKVGANAVNLSNVSFATNAGRQLAKACQDYGAYALDASFGSCSFYAEVALVGSSWLTQILNGPYWNAPDLQLIRSLLRRVTNSTSTTVGGGGTPLVTPPGNLE